MRAFACVALACGTLVLACSHDLDKLQEDLGSDIRGNDSGSGGSSGSSGNGGTAGNAGSSGASSVPDGGGPDSGAPMENITDCAPCQPLTERAEELGLVRCCRGVARSECGIGLPGGALCLPLDVPGEPDPSCPSVGPDDSELAGCCRPDARCGVDASEVGIGCIARDELPLSLGGARQPLACRLPCEEDDDCESLGPTSSICVEDVQEVGERFCVVQCARNRDCSEGLSCALYPDRSVDRSVSICREPLGTGGPNTPCTALTDCESGVCAGVDARSSRFCSVFCETPADCPAVLPRCVPSEIPRPVDNTQSDRLPICLPRVTN